MKRCFVEAFDDDYEEYQKAKKDSDRAHSRSVKASETELKIWKKKTQFTIDDRTFWLEPDKYFWHDVKLCTEGRNFEHGIDMRDDDVLHDLLRMVFKTLGIEIGNAELYRARSEEDLDELIDLIEKYREAMIACKKALKVAEELLDDNSVINRVKDKRHDDSLEASGKETDAHWKALKSLEDETPDFEEGGYAVWKSKKGSRKVTVVSVDEPNQRAKINTPKGATMYVPLSSLSKLVDYKGKGLKDENDYIEED